MKVETIIEQLLKIKADYVNITNEEILKILEIKTLMEGNNINGR